MKVEFLTNEELNDGRQIMISESEFKKAKDNDDEYESFAFATDCLFALYGLKGYIYREEYEKILSCLEKGGAVIITVVKDRYRRDVYPEVFVSNNNRLKRVEL